MSKKFIKSSVIIFSFLILSLFISKISLAGYVQQGSKLVGTGAVGASRQSKSVSVSADGNTAIVGGYTDDTNKGAAWIFTRTNGVWSQQGNKLVGTGAVGAARQGYSVSVSADGNTAIVGGYDDGGGNGAVWIYTRTNGVWSQQGNKLVGIGAVGASWQGISVSLSADGNTAMVGGTNDDGGKGAVWIYTRTNGVWSQQGNKLVGTGAAGLAYQGISVSLSADSNTAIIGGYGDDDDMGATWIFTRSNGVWSQQGNKLVGTGVPGAYAYQGISVSLSADGNTAMVGGFGDNSYMGAAWIFTRTNGVWSQQGNKLVGTGAVGAAEQGSFTALSSDGNVLLMGGGADNSHAGAAWIFTRTNGVWSQQGNKLVGTGAVGAGYQGYSVCLSDDSNTAIVGGYADNTNIGAAWVFTWENPLPTLTSITPTSTTREDPEFTLTATGTDFVSSSTIDWDGTPLVTTYVSATELTAIVPASNIATDDGTVNITVTSPTPGGGTTNPQVFTINPTPVSSSGSRPRPKTTVSTPEVIPTIPTLIETTCTTGDKYSSTTGLPCTSFTTPSTSLGQATPNTPTTCMITLTLRQGNTGEQVKCLQTKLNITSDGIFGSITKAAVIIFQKAHSLTPDGIVGPMTRAVL